MKVYINKYKNHWISPYTICEKVCFWREIEYDEPWVKVANTILEPVMTLANKILNVVDRKIDYVKIDRWDTWSMDSTLSKIILPMLKQIKETKHGSPHVEDEDVPEYLRSHMAQPKDYEWDTDSLWHMRWDWVINEMIFAFEKLNEEDWEQEFFKGKEWDKEGYTKMDARIQNGLTLFGKYFRALWD